MSIVAKAKKFITYIATTVGAIVAGMFIAFSGAMSADAFVTSANFSSSSYIVIPELTSTGGSRCAL